MASYPGSIVSFTRQVNCASPVIDEYSLDEDDVNLPYDEIEAIETELGTNPSGGSATVGTRIGLTEAAMLPIGAIIMWGGSYGTIPAGFSMCNGSGGTPNLQHRFVRCTTGTEAAGDTGGADTTTLSITHIPNHNHSGSSNATFNHTHTMDTGGSLHAHTMKKEQVFQTGTNRSGVYQGGIGTYSPGDPCVNSGSHTHSNSWSGTHSHTITVGYTGSGSSFGNMPSYYELIFIQKTS